VAVEVVMETPVAFAASQDLAPSLSKWVSTLNSMDLPFTSFEEPYNAQSCQEVPRMQGRKDSTDADGRRRLRSRRLRSRSRRLKGGGGAGAAAAGSVEEQVTETWTSLGSDSAGELQRLPVGAFGGVLVVWAMFIALACVRSVYDQYEEEGLTKKQRQSRASGSLVHAVDATLTPACVPQPTESEQAMHEAVVGRLEQLDGQMDELLELRGQVADIRGIMQAMLVAQRQQKGQANSPSPPRSSSMSSRRSSVSPSSTSPTQARAQKPKKRRSQHNVRLADSPRGSGPGSTVQRTALSVHAI